MASRFLRALLAGIALACLASAWAAPRAPGQTPSSFDPALMQIDEMKHLGAPLDAALPLLDSDGHPFRLGELFGKPVLLVLSYYSCDGSCAVLNQALAEALGKLQRFGPGRDFRVLTVSFDGHDDPAAIRAFRQKLALPPALATGWRHAVMQGKTAGIEALTGAVGFRYFWSQADRNFVHPNVMIFLTPEGRIARYLYGTALDPKSIELALIDADWGRIAQSSSLIDMLNGVCYSYNYVEGKYQPNYALLIGSASLVCGISLMALGAFMYRRKMRRMAHA